MRVVEEREEEHTQQCWPSGRSGRGPGKRGPQREQQPGERQRRAHMSSRAGSVVV